MTEETKAELAQADTSGVDILKAKITPKTLAAILHTPAVPDRYESVSDLTAAVLYGRELGVAPMSAITNLYLVNGSVSMKSSLMLALIQQHGHRITVNIGSDSATATAYFNWSGDMDVRAELGSFTFSLEDAKRAKLIKKGGAWETYPTIMCAWRAISMAARFCFPELILGLLPPEEVGLEVEVEALPAEIIEDADVIDEVEEEQDELTAEEVAEEFEGEVVVGEDD